MNVEVNGSGDFSTTILSVYRVRVNLFATLLLPVVGTLQLSRLQLTAFAGPRDSS